MSGKTILKRIISTIVGAAVGAIVGFFVAWPVWWIAAWLVPLIRPTLAFAYEGPPPSWLHISWALFLGLVGGAIGYFRES